MSHASSPIPVTSHPAQGLSGLVVIPGDKSISHRAVLLGGVARGTTEVEGLLEGEDVLRTADAMRALGATVINHGAGRWSVTGTGVGCLLQPGAPLDFGNSGTGCRLMMGLTAGHGLEVTFDGDASLRKRPMGRITQPLAKMGAKIVTSAEGERLPLTLQGPETTIPITYTLPVPSAQVKSAILLAGLDCPGITTVIEPEATRDHTERMLRYFGAELAIEESDTGRTIALTGRPDLVGQPVNVPADPSSAAFAIVAALICADSEIRMEGILLNATRTGLITTLREMGGQIHISNQRDWGGETVGDLTIRSSMLRGVDVPPERAPSMIDEYPVLAVAASYSTGVTRMTGIGELRVKESDRIQAVVDGLEANGVRCAAGDDWLEVTGNGQPPRGGGIVTTHLDHRIAMSFLVMGCASQTPVTVDDGAVMDTSFPGFVPLMENLGARLSRAGEA